MSNSPTKRHYTVNKAHIDCEQYGCFLFCWWWWWLRAFNIDYSDFRYCFHSWQVNGEDKTNLATQKNFSSELRFKAMEDAVVNCTADNRFGIDWKTGNISVLSKKSILQVAIVFFCFFLTKRKF